jgi:1-acyl-sn-glycerol-3-phosphate acyltransferase
MRKKPNILYIIAVKIFNIYTYFVYKIKIKGRKNLKKVKGKSFIIVANHITNSDFLSFLPAFPSKKFHLRFLAKSSLFKIPILKNFLLTTGQIPVYRNTSHASDSLIDAKNALENNSVIVIFPEGTCTKDPLKLPQKFKTGAIRLAKDTGVPIIPIAHFKKNRKIIVKISKPVYIKKIHSVLLKTNYLQNSITKTVKKLQQEI